MAQVAEMLGSKGTKPSRIAMRLSELAAERGEEIRLRRLSPRKPLVIPQADFLRLFPEFAASPTDVERLEARVCKLQRVLDGMRNRIFATERKTNARG